MKKASLFLLIMIAAGGCAAPGETIELIQETPNTVALEYTHSYSFELGETIKRAERYCNRHSKSAELVSNTRLNLDRSLATFRCVRY
jgi:hypothetical protein